MMYASRPASRLQHDPQPFLVKETGARVDESAFGTPGVTIFFSPRPEFLPAQLLPVNEVLVEVRDHFSSDTWGSSMLWLAIVSAWVERLAGKAPKEWRTDLPWSRVDPDAALGELVLELGPEKILPQLLHAGAVLERVADLTELAGKTHPLERVEEDDDF